MKRLLLLATLALVASACKIDAGVRLDLSRAADAGDLFVTLETDQEFEELFAITDRAFEDLLAERGAVVGLTFRVIDTDTGRIYTTGAEGLSYEALENVLERLAPGFGNMAINSRGGTLEIDAQIAALEDLDDVAPFFTDFDPSEFQDDARASLIITLPGDVSSSSADSISGDTYTWNLALSGDTTRVVVRSVVVPPGEGGLPWTVVLVVGGLIVAVGFLLAIRSGLTRYPRDEEAGALPTPQPVPPEDQDSTPPEFVEPPSVPPEDQPVAPVDPY